MKTNLTIFIVIVFSFITILKFNSSAQSNSIAPQTEKWLSIFPVGQQIFGLYCDVQDPNTLYACTSRGLFMTSNGGMRWTHSFFINSTSLTLSQCKNSPNIMYLGGGNYTKGGVFKTIDGGKIWQKIGAQDITQVVQGVKVDYQNPDIIYVLTPSVLFKSLNGGRTWGTVTPPSISGFLEMDPLNSSHLIVKAFHDLLESLDGGLSWKPFKTGDVSLYRRDPYSFEGTSSVWESYGFHPNNAKLHIATVTSPGFGSNLIISSDGGASWNCISILEMNSFRGKPWMTETTAFGWSQKSLRTIYAGTANSLYVSTDYGNHWTSLLPYSTSSFVISPSGDLFAATSIGVLKSQDEGLHWRFASLGLPNQQAGNSNLFQAIQISGQQIYVGANGGIWMSPDGGVTWAWHSIDIPQLTGIVKDILVMKDHSIFLNQGEFLNIFGQAIVGEREAHILKHPRGGKFIKVSTNKFPNTIMMCSNDSATIYMTDANTTSLLKSEDSGFSWETFNLGSRIRPALAGSEIIKIPIIATALESSKIVYAAIVLKKPMAFGGDIDYALLQTFDGGVTWQDIFPDKLIPHQRIISTLGDISTIAIDPKNSRTIYIAFNKGVFRTGDGGKTWKELPINAGKINNIVVSSQSSNILYLGAETGFWESQNAGESWVLSSNHDNIHRIISVDGLTLAQGDNAIYRLSSSDLSWLNLRWKELDEKP